MRRFTFAIGLLVALILGAATPVVATQSPQSSSPAAAPAPVNINTATLAQLEKLPGIGAVTAQRIVEYREKNGAFKKVEELMNVRGVGEKSFLKLKPLITVGTTGVDKPGWLR